MSTGIVYSERYIDHDTGPHHPERPDRLRAIHQKLAQTGLLETLQAVEPQLIDPLLIQPVHAVEYIRRFQTACGNGTAYLNTPECPVRACTFEIARLAAGGGLAAVDAVMAGRARNAFCPVRPPGHHAEYRAAMGFCYFNNIAIAAEYLLSRYNLGRVAVVDFDVHHGNGTQHQFDENPNVLFASVHQHPDTLFPGTGYVGEVGRGAAAGTTLNVAMFPRNGNEEYHKAFDETILPALADFKPAFILVSAGFDAHRDDPLAQIELTTDMFGWMTRELRILADQICEGRLVTMLEGGYNLAALADSVQSHVEALAGLDR